MLLVHDDDADIAEWRQDRRPGPDDDIHVAGPDPSPLVGPLAVAEAGVDERHPDVEVRPDPVDEREGHRDLGDEDAGPAGRVPGWR